MGSAATDASLKLDFETFHNTINNTLVQTSTTRHGINPSTEEALPPVPVSSQADVDVAVQAGQEAFPKWRALSWDERAAYILKFADAIDANLPGLTEMLGKEAGKPVQGAGFEFVLTLGHLRETAKLRVVDEVVEDNEERTAAIRYTPLGVGVGIVPWNFPVLLGIGKMDSALLSGNTFIWKPSPYAPYTTLKLGELGAKIFPPGVLQVLSGGDDLGPMLTSHPGVAKISFTGSTATGKRVMKSAAENLARVTLELGGNDAAVVLEDAELEKVVPKIATFIFLNGGQICMNIKRVYVHSSIYPQFLSQLVAFVTANFKVGPHTSPDAMFGPIQNAMQFAKVQDIFASLSKEGLSCALPGGKATHLGDKGYFMLPTIVDNPPDTSRIVQEEPFGPIIPITKFESEDEVVKRVNDSKMGLGASVWTKDIARGQKVASQLEAGSIWVNTHFELAPYMPFGGHKWSGLGMDWGVVGLKGWCNPQAVWTRKKL